VSGEVVDITSVAGLTIRVAVMLAVCGLKAESVAFTVSVLVPAVVGVPESIPAELNVRPPGRVPALTFQVSGEVPPVAAKVRL